MRRPSASSAFARASTSNAVSVPSRPRLVESSFVDLSTDLAIASFPLPPASAASRPYRAGLRRAVSADPQGWAVISRVIPASNLLEFVGAALVLIAIPGPSVLFVISRGVVLGRRAALATVVGNCAGVYVQVIAVALGVGVIVERSAAVFTTIKLVGAAYLVVLGRRARSGSAARSSRPSALPVAAEERTPDPPGRLRRRAHEPEGGGLLRRDPAAVRRLRARATCRCRCSCSGLVFVAIAMVIDGTWGLARRDGPRAASRPRRAGSRRSAAQAGCVMVGLGLGPRGRRGAR